jgi:hypothetical protein
MNVNTQIIIEGTVQHDSIPLEFASIIIKNTTKGVAADEKGEFKLEAKKGDTLSVSYLGYKTKEFLLDESKSIKVDLEVDGLDEVVVAGYQSRAKCWFKRSCGVYFEDETVHEKLNVNNPKLYPNPSSNGIFQLKLPKIYNEVKISVANMSGQVVLIKEYQNFGNQKKVDLTKFPTGVYIVNIIAKGEKLKAIKAIRS